MMSLRKANVPRMNSETQSPFMNKIRRHDATMGVGNNIDLKMVTRRSHQKYVHDPEEEDSVSALKTSSPASHSWHKSKEDFESSADQQFVSRITQFNSMSQADFSGLVGHDQSSSLKVDHDDQRKFYTAAVREDSDEELRSDAEEIKHTHQLHSTTRIPLESNSANIANSSRMLKAAINIHPSSEHAYQQNQDQQWINRIQSFNSMTGQQAKQMQLASQTTNNQSRQSYKQFKSQQRLNAHEKKSPVSRQHTVNNWRTTGRSLKTSPDLNQNKMNQGMPDNVVSIKDSMAMDTFNEAHEGDEEQNEFDDDKIDNSSAIVRHQAQQALRGHKRTSTLDQWKSQVTEIQLQEKHSQALGNTTNLSPIKKANTAQNALQQKINPNEILHIDTLNENTRPVMQYKRAPLLRQMSMNENFNDVENNCVSQISSRSSIEDMNIDDTCESKIIFSTPVESEHQAKVRRRSQDRKIHRALQSGLARDQSLVEKIKNLNSTVDSQVSSHREQLEQKSPQQRSSWNDKLQHQTTEVKSSQLEGANAHLKIAKNQQDSPSCRIDDKSFTSHTGNQNFHDKKVKHQRQNTVDMWKHQVHALQQNHIPIFPTRQSDFELQGQLLQDNQYQYQSNVSSLNKNIVHIDQNDNMERSKKKTNDASSTQPRTLTLYNNSRDNILSTTISQQYSINNISPKTIGKNGFKSKDEDQVLSSDNQQKKRSKKNFSDIHDQRFLKQMQSSDTLRTYKKKATMPTNLFDAPPIDDTVIEEQIRDKEENSLEQSDCHSMNASISNDSESIEHTSFIGSQYEQDSNEHYTSSFDFSTSSNNEDDDDDDSIAVDSSYHITHNGRLNEEQNYSYCSNDDDENDVENCTRRQSYEQTGINVVNQTLNMTQSNETSVRYLLGHALKTIGEMSRMRRISPTQTHLLKSLVMTYDSNLLDTLRRDTNHTETHRLQQALINIVLQFHKHSLQLA